MVQYQDRGVALTSRAHSQPGRSVSRGRETCNVVKEEFSSVHLTAMDMQALAPPTLMLAMQILPESSWSATVRNRARPDPILEVNWPSSVTSLYLFNRFSRGMRTLLKLQRTRN